MFLRKLVLALVALIVFMMSWQAGHVIGFSVGGLGVLAISGLLAFLFALAFLLFGRHEVGREPVPMDASVLLFGIFVAFNFASIGWADRPMTALSSSITYFQLLIFVWLLAFLRSEKYAFSILLHAYLVGISVIAFGTMMEISLHGLAELDRRLDGFNMTSNRFAYKLLLGIPISIYLFQRSTVPGYRWFYLYYVPLGLVLVILAGSRTGLVALGAVLAVFAWFFVTVERGNATRISPTRALVAVGALGAVVVSLIPFLADRIPRHIERFSTLADPMASGIGNRSDMWTAAIEVYLNNLLLGVGSGGGGTAILPYFEGDVYVFSFLDRGVSLHSVYLTIATGTGTVGLLLFLAVIVTLILRALSFAREERLLFLSMIGASLVMALTLGLEQSRDFFFAVFLPVALSVARYPARARANKRDIHPFAPLRKQQHGVRFY
jgi:O-antigen ligase